MYTGDTEFHIAVSLRQSYKGQFTCHLYHAVCKIKRYNCLQQFYILFYKQFVDYMWAG